MAQAPADAGVHLAMPAQNVVLGIGLLVVAMTVIPVMDGLAKLLSANYPVLQITWARYTFHLATMLPVLLWRHGVRTLVPPKAGLQLLRGACILASTLLFFAGLARMPLANTLALAFISPFVVTALSPWLLGERVGPRRWAAVGCGFLGALIVFRPGFGDFGWEGLLPMGAGVGYACYLILTRRLAGAGPALVTLAYSGLVGTVALSLVVPFVWSPPDAAGWSLMVLMGLLAAVGHFLLIRAFELAPASLLAPLGYGEIVGATAVGYLLFGDFPDRITWIGVTVIVASGLFIVWRERTVRPA